MPAGRVNARSRVFVVGAYAPDGGMHMAYQLGRILSVDFALDVFAVTVGKETPDAGLYDYAPIFPSISLADLSRLATANDVLIANPSFSRLNLGLTSPALKVSYVQHFNTFRTLDLLFDHFVSVSAVVQSFLRSVYRLETIVIPPFVERCAAPTWRERPAGSIAIHCKGDMRQQLLILDRLRRAIGDRLPGDALERILPRARQAEFLAGVGAARCLLNLSVAEGFGLVPLEAMAMGTTVVAFDALGGRDYMRPGENCEAVAYPDIQGLAEGLMRVFNSTEHAERLGRAGAATAADYSYQRFRGAWREAFARIFGWS